jgi:hypothetical protein
VPQGFRLAARAGSPGDVEQDGGGRTRCIARWSVASTAAGRSSQQAPAGNCGAAQIGAGGNAAAAERPVTIAEVGSIMARKRQLLENGFVLFNVTYEDGTQSSNRKVPSTEIDQLDAEASARAFIEAQDRKIETMSGRSRGPIKAIVRADAR